MEAARKRFSRAFEGTVALQHLDFRFLASRTTCEYILVIVSQQIFGNLLWQPQEINTCTLEKRHSDDVHRHASVSTGREMGDVHVLFPPVAVVISLMEKGKPVLYNLMLKSS